MILSKSDTCNGCKHLNFGKKECAGGCVGVSGKLGPMPLNSAVVNDGGYIQIVKHAKCGGKVERQAKKEMEA